MSPAFGSSSRAAWRVTEPRPLGGSLRARCQNGGVEVDEAAVTAALRAAGARFSYVHGSRNDGNPMPGTDFDVAAWFGGRAPASWDVDLPAKVDLLVLDTAPLYLAGRVALRGRLLFANDAAARVGWEADTRTMYLDELPYIRQMSAEYLQAVARGRR